MILHSSCRIAWCLWVAALSSTQAFSPHNNKNSNKLSSGLLSSSALPSRTSQSQYNDLSSFKLFSKPTDNDGGGGDDDNELQRMEMVRSLQKSFYSQQDDDPTASPRPSLDPTTGIMKNLPLWSVGWTEVPGRANCLNVHEGQYTHMFETILSGPQPWYVGHLHLPGGFKMTRTKEYRYQLKNWKDEVQDEERFYTQESRSAVMGALMRITDYRRLTDGRLVLLVHVLERFVVDNVVQEFPYSVADVQILVDGEELPPQEESDENFRKVARASAVNRSFKYHDYECDSNIKLPLADDSEYLSTNSVIGEEIAKLLPFAYYSPDDSCLDDLEEEEEKRKASIESYAGSFSGGSASMETLLQRGRILCQPPSLPGAEKRDVQSTDATETLLWLALEDFCRATGFVLPEEVLCLMPPHMDYLDMEPPKQRVSNKYPAIRRQHRLSYAVAALIEPTDVGVNLRHILLAAPTTQARLSSVLERFELLNSRLGQEMLGEFQ